MNFRLGNHQAICLVYMYLCLGRICSSPSKTTPTLPPLLVSRKYTRSLSALCRLCPLFLGSIFTAKLTPKNQLLMRGLPGADCQLAHPNLQYSIGRPPCYTCGNILCHRETLYSSVVISNTPIHNTLYHHTSRSLSQNSPQILVRCRSWRNVVVLRKILQHVR